MILSLEALAAWAPGLESPDQWRAWARDPWLPVMGDAPRANGLPAMLRRRLEPVGRAALQVAANVLPAITPDALVFVSRRGEPGRTYRLLEQLVRGEAVSPSGFGLSVHNAVAAQLSIWQGYRRGFTAIAAGPEGVEHGFLELASRLAGREGAVGLLVVFEDAVPEEYGPYLDEPDPRFAWAARFRMGGVGPALRLRSPEPGPHEVAVGGGGPALRASRAPSPLAGSA
ncbi:MAG: hypothetical protein KatS3mg126_0642 [Lysobacteraceae bacterium]|nr:MAG: hypothetical protein KatS3mg126_0642 [Xanthomonadaceae bacterium]